MKNVFSPKYDTLVHTDVLLDVIQANWEFQGQVQRRVRCSGGSCFRTACEVQIDYKIKGGDGE